ncbi:uncharacterized protein LOC113508356 isoform X1 [Trichoplusia ni]|uniref:Uncharacterized protein LOC113508356 isoform X1 n=1 Tax=Trichoplusia ni TaxID=7111 RepID=A0A7E5X3A0_TRINI|nr:uncharacterized protein LOC113508356 isoform X1 [Trichoplusia ni]
MADDDDEGAFGGMYEDGHWVWDDNAQALAFVSDIPPKLIETIQMTAKAPTGNIEFRDDVDLIEQIRYRRRYQRKLKPGQPDVITLQDIKDIALYTAPVSILSPMLINVLHIPTTERFLRALILCCAYYLQVADEMAIRMIELDTKVRTPDCEHIENEYRDNLADLRVLVAKEYCIMLIGGADTKKFHHMGPQKKLQSLSDKDARLFETLLRMSVQIVWLALGRRSFHQIELETHRIFKSEIFNEIEHTLKTGYISKMIAEEQAVLLGPCVRRQDKKLNTRSPLMNEVFCHRPIDYRLLGLGVVKYPETTNRLQYLHVAVSGPEEILMESHFTLGIIGMPRSGFDTMLRPVTVSVETKSKASMSSHSGHSSKTSVRKSTVPQQLYPPLVIPPKDIKDVYFPPHFPDKSEKNNPISDVQRRRWQNRLVKLLNPPPPTH